MYQKGHTLPRTPAGKGVLKEETQLAKSQKGPDEPERGGKAASHNGKATDSLESCPCLAERPKRHREDGPGPHRTGTGGAGSGGRGKGVSRARSGCEAATSAGGGAAAML